MIFIILFLLLAVAILAAILVLREPDLRRRLVAGLVRGQGHVRAALGMFQPRDIQRQALALVKEQGLLSIGFVHLPTEIAVRLNPGDLDRLGATSDHVATELADQISTLRGANAGGELEYLLAARPQVTLKGDASISRGTVHVDAGWLEGTEAATAVPQATTQNRPAGPRLRIVAEGEAPREAMLSGTMTLGREPGSDIPINHLGVSRRHAMIALEGSRVTITDLKSVNGVEVDGEPIPPNSPSPIVPGLPVRLSKHVQLELLPAGDTEMLPTEPQGSDG